MAATLVNKLRNLQDGESITVEDFASLDNARRSLQFANWGEHNAVQNAFDPARGFGKLYTMVTKRLQGELVLYYK